ncbi:MAG: hypothetical protein OHK0029_26620 [Armatimonadaceae bacterium]
MTVNNKPSEYKCILPSAFTSVKKKYIAQVIVGLSLFVLIHPLPSSVAQTPVSEVPFEILSAYTSSPAVKHQGPVIGVKINGGQRVERFLIDTGATGTVITQSIAKRYHLKESSQQFRINEESLRSTGAKADSIPSGRKTTIDAIEVGNFEFEGEVLVVDDAVLNRVLGEHKLAGIIGMDILSQFAVEINSSTNKIKLFGYGKLSPAQLKETGYTQPGNEGIPLVNATQISTAKQSSEKRNENESEYETGEFFVEVQINNALTTPLLVDTGSQRSNLSFAVHNKVKEKQIKPSKKFLREWIGRAHFQWQIVI